MIRYHLICDAGHDYDAWFPSSAAYDRQAERGLLACAVCSSLKVEKAIMAPSVRTSEIATRPALPTVTSPAAEIAERVVATMPPEVAAKLREIRDFIRNNADYVGQGFAEEARKIHYREAEARGIYGEASRQDVEALLEEGIEIAPVPMLPDDRN